MSGSSRAVWRWAWRLFRREWRQQILTILLLVIAVGAAGTGAAMAVNSQHDDRGLFGGGDLMVRVSAADAATVRDAISHAEALFGRVDPIWHAAVPVPGSSDPLDLRRQDPGGPFGGAKLSLLEGRYPEAADELAVSDPAAEVLGVGVGDPLEFGGVSGTVVGRVEDPTDLDIGFVLAQPDLDAPADFVTLLAEGGPDGARRFVDSGVQGGFQVASRFDQHEPPTAVMVVLAVTVVLALVGLVAAASFVVVAQRRQRQLGLLASIGGAERDLRRVMVVGGIAVGIVAAVAGTLLGIAGWIAMRPVTEEAAGQRRGNLDLPWLIVAVTAGLAVVVSALAAWWPARQVARLPIMTALSGRPVTPRPVRRSMLVASVLLVAGVWLVVLSEPETNEVNGILLSLGLIVVICGVVFVAPAAVALLGALASRMPLAPRLALRDLSRYQARAAASLAAITLGLGIAVSVIAVAAENRLPDSEGDLAPSQLVVGVNDLPPGMVPQRSAAEVAALDAAAATVLAALGPDAAAVPLDLLYNPRAEPGARDPIGVGEPGEPGEPGSVRLLGWAYVATPAVLDHFGIDPASIDPAVDLLLAEDRPVQLVDLSAPPDPEAPPLVTQVVELPAYSSAPFALVTESAMARFGWASTRAEWFAELPEALTDTQVDAARDAAALVGLVVDVRDSEDDLAAISRWTTVGGVGLALAIVAMAVGLMRGEAARDVRTLTATGASPATRRALTASTAAALATLGSLLGVAGAYVFLIAVYRTDLGSLMPVPVTPLLVLLVGLPLLAAASGWLLGGREPATLGRRLLD